MKRTITVIEKALVDAGIKIQRTYSGFGLSITETRVVINESDFNSINEKRASADNGITWTSYKADADYFEKDKKKEILKVFGSPVPNMITGHVVRLVMERIFLYDHKKVYDKYWATGVMDWRDHTYIEISMDDGATYQKRYLLSYEDNTGIDYNMGYYGNNIEIGNDGTIYTCICASLESICRAYSLNADDYAKNPVVTNGVVVFSLKPMGEGYVISKSWPIIIDDSKSSRGLLEPNIIMLKSKELMVECRGSNAIADGWNTKMETGTPSYRWVAFGKTDMEFSNIMPMTYENKEAFYSPSSISKWLRHSVSKKLYWLGNITPENPTGNRPRYPLVIGQFDEVGKYLIKESIMVIDDRLPGESELIQHSNFTFYENRQTHEMCIEYSRIGQNPAYKWQGDAVRIVLEE